MIILIINSFLSIIFLFAGAGTILSRLFHIPIWFGILIYIVFLCFSLFIIINEVSDLDNF